MKLTDIGLQLVWINFESTIRENSKSVKSVKINPQKKRKKNNNKNNKKINLHGKNLFRAY